MSTRTAPVKKSRAATIFDVANFEWVLEMSLRRPRAFVDLYKVWRMDLLFCFRFANIFLDDEVPVQDS